MPIVPEKLFTGTLVTLTHAVTHTHIHRLSSSTSSLFHSYTHTHIHIQRTVLSCQADREQQGLYRLSLFPHPQEFSVCPLGSNRKIDLMDRKQQPPALTDAWINYRLLQGPCWDRQPPQPIQSSPNTQAQDMQSA